MEMFYLVFEKFLKMFYPFLPNHQFFFEMVSLRSSSKKNFALKTLFQSRMISFSNLSLNAVLMNDPASPITSVRHFSSSVRHFSNVVKLTHVDERGKAAMVDISNKPITTRYAVAVGRVWLNDVAFSAVENNSIAKGDVLTVAKIAGIMGAKRCPDLIPLCHSLSLTSVDVTLTLNPELKSIDIEASASTADRTGVEMESLTAVSVAALTIYDMCKAVARDTLIGDIKLRRKSGGQSGDHKSLS